MNVENLDWAIIQNKMNLRPSEVEFVKNALKDFPIEIPMTSLDNLEDITDVTDDDFETRAVECIVEEFILHYTPVRKLLDEIADMDSTLTEGWYFRGSDQYRWGMEVTLQHGDYENPEEVESKFGETEKEIKRLFNDKISVELYME